MRCKARSGALAFALVIVLAGACSERPSADPANAAQVARGKPVYDLHCASCHGAKLEGQPNWRQKLANGRFPAPPHDETGHTWHHADSLLFNITRNGIEAYAPAGYQSDMPAFRGRLTDEDIWAALAYIKSTWSDEIRQLQAKMNAEEKRK